MQNDDYTEFCDLLDGAYDLIGSGTNKIISGSAKSLFFSAMGSYSLQTVRAALGAHCLDKVRGRFTPKPADIIEQIEASAANDGRPGGEEAWAIALPSQDEANSVIWTDEIAESFSICRPVLESSGAISARKSFLEVYSRKVAQSQAERRPVRWSITLGWDKTQHAAVMEKAAIVGLLAAPAVHALLPAPDGDVVPDAKARAQLDGIRQMLADGTKAKERARLEAAESDRFADKEIKRRANEQVTQYLASGAANRRGS